MLARRSMLHLSKALGLCVVVSLAAACGSETAQAPVDSGTPDQGSLDVGHPDGTAPDGTAPDASTDDVAQADGGRDAAPDARPPLKTPSQLYGPCNADAECVEGFTCRTEADTGAPGGECNHECRTDDDCVLFPADGSNPVDGYCAAAAGSAPRRCLRVCLNGIDCERDGYTCRVFNANQVNEVQACVAICTDDSCVNGTVCDSESGRCRTPGFRPVGRTVGQTCAPAMRGTEPATPPEMQCRSENCNADWLPDSRGNRFYTGWNGGYCLGRCILPQGYNSSTFWNMTTLPQANCPSGSICYPNGSLSRGDQGVCLKECHNNGECRGMDGYICQQSVSLSATNIRRYMNGYCIPQNCANAATPCPTGLMCRRTTRSDGSVTGACVPPTPTM